MVHLETRKCNSVLLYRFTSYNIDFLRSSRSRNSTSNSPETCPFSSCVLVPIWPSHLKTSYPVLIFIPRVIVAANNGVHRNTCTWTIRARRCSHQATSVPRTIDTPPLVHTPHIRLTDHHESSCTAHVYPQVIRARLYTRNSGPAMPD